MGGSNTTSGSSYLFPSSKVISQIDYAMGGFPVLVCFLSILATALHYRQATHLNRVAKFHLFHCLYCILISVLKIIEGYTKAQESDGYKRSKILGMRHETCSNYVQSQIWFWLWIHLTWAPRIWSKLIVGPKHLNSNA